MKINRKKCGVPMILTCLLAGFLLSACGKDAGTVTDSLTNSDIKADMNSKYTYIGGYLCIPFSEIEVLIVDTGATYVSYK